MKPFSMEPVLRYRKQLADEARQKHFASKKKEGEIQERLFQVEKRLAKLYTDLAHEKAEGTTIDRLLLFENRILTLQETLKKLHTELEEQQKIVARRRRRLLQAGQDKKALEKLKEKQNLAYKQYKDKKEAAMLDEVAVLRHGRQSNT
jgi:flagellar FliJ protein